MSNINFKTATLFPKKTSFLGIVLVSFLFIITCLIVLKMWNAIKETDEQHFPMVERSAINVRLVNLVNYQFTLAITTKNKKVVEDLKLNFDSLHQNFLSLLEISNNSTSFNDPQLFLKGSKLIQLMKENKWIMAQDLFTKIRFSDDLNNFSMAIYDETELMAENRDLTSVKILKLIQNTVFVAVLTIIFLLYLIVKIYKGYSSNLSLRLFAEEKAKQLSHQRQTLIHVLCHDLGNPISAIFSLTQVAHLLPKEDKENMLKTIQSNAKTSLDLIELTRKMQALETGKLDLELSGISLKKSVIDSKEILFEKLNSKSLELVIDIPDDYKVLAEPTSLINSILNNIITNSIKFSEKGSKVNLVARRIDGSTIELKIRDFGIGIPLEILPHIFSETYETSRMGTDGELGTGFGMPLVKKFMLAYGGSIDVVSTTLGEDSGTTTTLIFKS